MNFGSVDSPLTIKMLNALIDTLEPGRIEPVRPHSFEDSICEHCGQMIVRDGAGFGWKHYPTFEKECDPHPTASPKRDTAGNVIPLTGK